VNLDGNHASISEVIDAGVLAGAVTMVWQTGQVLQVNELGYRDVHAELPMQRDTIFRIASMTSRSPWLRRWRSSTTASSRCPIPSRRIYRARRLGRDGRSERAAREDGAVA